MTAKKFILLPAIFLLAHFSANAGRAPRNERYGSKGHFIKLHLPSGSFVRAYAAGPTDAKAAVIFVHDYFGLSAAALKSAKRLGALGYLTIAVDLYRGKTARTNSEAEMLMKAKDTATTRQILQAATIYLERPGRKLASVGFSAGGIDALYANLLDPAAFKATVIVYGGGYEQLDAAKLAALSSPVLAITGAQDHWALQSALHFLETQKHAAFELYVYPHAEHGYAQPLFNSGKNYDPEATRVTWMLLQDFLMRNLGTTGR